MLPCYCLQEFTEGENSSDYGGREAGAGLLSYGNRTGVISEKTWKENTERLHNIWMVYFSSSSFSMFDCLLCLQVDSAKLEDRTARSIVQAEKRHEGWAVMLSLSSLLVGTLLDARVHAIIYSKNCNGNVCDVVFIKRLLVEIFEIRNQKLNLCTSNEKLLVSNWTWFLSPNDGHTFFYFKLINCSLRIFCFVA